MRISDWSSDVCSSDLLHGQAAGTVGAAPLPPIGKARTMPHQAGCLCGRVRIAIDAEPLAARMCWCRLCQYLGGGSGTVNVCFPSDKLTVRSEEHTSELQSLIRISYAVFCLKKKKH